MANGPSSASLAPGKQSSSAAASLISRRRWLVVIALFCVVVTGFFDRISIAVLFTNQDFNQTIGTIGQPAKLGLLMSAFLFAYAFSAIFLSFIGDLIGPRRALASAAALWGVLMWIAGACSSYLSFVALRIILGFSEGPQFSLVSKLVQRLFPPSEQARANAIWMVGSPIGSAIGFPLTIWIVSQYGWRASFYVLGALSLLFVAPLVWIVTRDMPVDAGVPQQNAGAMQSLRRQDMAILFRDKRFWLLSLYGCGLLTYLWGLNSWLPSYLSRAKHFNVHEMGFYSSLPFILMFVAEVASGIIADRTGRRALLSVVGLCGAGVLMYLATCVSSPTLAAILIACSAGSWGFGLPAQYALAMRVIPASVMSTGIGVMNGIGNLIGACAPVMIGTVISMTGNYESGLLVIVIASIVGSLMLLPLLKDH